MNTLELARKRCSIRQYSPAPVEGEKLGYILEVARLAPSACNYQPWRLLVVVSQDGRKKLHDAVYAREWIKPAPLFIVVCGDHARSWKRPADGKDHLDVDAGIIAEHICLAATEQGLGTCIICHFDAPFVAGAFNLPGTVEPVAIIPIGYPADPGLFAATAKIRKSVEEIIFAF
ncbi:MAG: nitroreductase family protein [Tannerellaceae bacterium]|jgi:nitroreductase|nr:nitroreductase family protein [Tannerellaceae bacterium]